MMRFLCKSAFAILLAAMVSIAAPVNSAELPNAGSLNLNLPQQQMKPVFSVETNNITPPMNSYLAAVRDKVQQSGAKDWPRDRSGKRMPGEVLVRITLRKDGFIDDIQTSPMSEGNDALSETVRGLVRSAEPFPPFPPNLFGGYEFVAFSTTIGFSPDVAQQGPKPRVNAEGNGQRLQLRTGIPF